MINIVDDEVIKAELQDGLSQVDENLTVDDFQSVYEQNTRKLIVHFAAVNSETQESIDINKVWG